MPFIRVTRRDNVVIDINTVNIIQFYPQGGNTRIDLKDNITHDIVDEVRQLRGYIKKAEGTLPEKQEPNVANTPAPAWVDPAPSLERV